MSRPDVEPGHKHHMIHGWLVGRKEYDWVCATWPCRQAWTPHKTIRGLWKQFTRTEETK